MKTVVSQTLLAGAVCFLALCLGGTPAAHAAVYTFTATNMTGQPAYDLEVDFINTGGAVNNLQILLGGGIASLNGPVGAANGYVVDWNVPGLANGATSSVQFTAPAGIVLNSAEWTDLGFPGSGVNVPAGGNLAPAPEPGSLFFLGSGAAGLSRFLRRRVAKGS